jgi:hypothetical protein
MLGSDALRRHRPRRPLFSPSKFLVFGVRTPAMAAKSDSLHASANEIRESQQHSVAMMKWETEEEKK